MPFFIRPLKSSIVNYLKNTLFYQPNASLDNYQSSNPESCAECAMNPHQYFHIWFSKDRSSFLTPRNKKRLISQRETNPSDLITFIYSAQLLSTLAILKLYYFCYSFKIIPVNFDNIATITDPVEQQLYLAARDEISNHENGGNFAAASDCARVLSFTAGMGFYADWEAIIRTQGLPQKMPIKAPIIYNYIPGKSFNNDILYIANFGSAEVKAIQQKMVENWYLAKKDGPFNMMPNDAKRMMKLFCPSIQKDLEYETAENKLFSTRQALEKIIREKEKRIRYAFTQTVCPITGPLVLHAALEYYTAAGSEASRKGFSFWNSVYKKHVYVGEGSDLDWVPKPVEDGMSDNGHNRYGKI